MSKTRQTRIVSSIGAVAFVLTGCRAAFDYPDSKEESGAELCANGTDDDFDGVIDCDDPSCDGLCPEQDAVRCADGRDNDGDGLTDEWDPRCWHLKGPTAVRCASVEAIDFEERFDAVLSEARWQPFGDDPETGSPLAHIAQPTNRVGRSDSVLGFAAPTGAATETGIASGALFDGDWDSFELGFQALVSDGGGLRVALLPPAYVTKNGLPLEGAALDSLAVEVHPSGRLVVTVDGADREAGGVERGTWHAFRLVSDGRTLSLSVDENLVLETESHGLFASRLVVWDTTNVGKAQLDDLSLRIAGKSPCGVDTPQIPRCDGCGKDETPYARDVGMTVSVARDEQGSFCAVTIDGEPSQSSGAGARSWLSDTGTRWQLGGALAAGVDGDVWVGASVARDVSTPAQWHAAVVTEGIDGTVLHRLSSPDCAGWNLDGSLPLPAGASSPSYLLPGVVSLHELYFVLAPQAGQGPTIGRYRSDDGDVFYDDGAPVAVLPLDAAIETPISITRGSR